MRSTTKNSSTKAMGTIMGISWRAMRKVALVTPRVSELLRLSGHIPRQIAHYRIRNSRSTRL